jgi:hypothetical protein
VGLFADSLRIAQRVSYTSNVDGYEGGQPEQLTPIPDSDAVKAMIADYLSTVDITGTLSPYISTLQADISLLSNIINSVITTTTTRDANGNVVSSTTNTGVGLTSLTGTANQLVTNSSIGDVTISIPNNPLLPGVVTAQGFAPSGFSGSTQPTRFMGGTVSGAPTTGTWLQGDYVVGITNGTMWVCTTAGSPGTWSGVGGGFAGFGASVVSETAFGQSAALGSGTTAAYANHTHGTPATPVTSAIAGAGIGVSGATGAVTITNSGVTNLALGATTANLTLTASTGSIQVSMSPTPSFTTVGVSGLSTLSGNAVVKGTLDIQTTGSSSKFFFNTATSVATFPTESLSGDAVIQASIPYNRLTGAAQASIQAFPAGDSQFSMLRWVTSSGSFTDANGQQRDGLTINNSATRVADSTAYAGYSIANTGMTTNVLAVSGPGYTGLQPGQYQAVYYVKVSSTASSSAALTLQVTGTAVSANPTVAVSPSQLATTYIGVVVPFTITSTTNTVNTTITSNQLPGAVTWQFSHVRVQQFDGLTTSSTSQYFFANAAITSAQIQSLTASSIIAGTIAADDIFIGSGGHIYMGTKAGARTELSSAGISSYLSTDLTNPTVQITNTGTFQLRSANTGTRINLQSSVGIELYNGATRTFFADVATGNLTLTGSITATSGAFTGDVQISTGSLYAGASATSGQRLRVTSSGITAFNGAGTQTFSVTTAGNVTMSGSSTLGGSLTVDGTATLNGLIQTATNTGSLIAGITIDPTGVKGYNSSSTTPVVVIDAVTGALSASSATFTGTLTVGAATTLNGTLTLGTGTISSTNFTVSSAGVVNATSATLSSVTIQNTSTLNGTVAVGATLTVSGTIQSATTVGVSGSGYRLSTSGLEFYNVSTRNFYVDMSGNVTSSGTLSLAGSLNVAGQINAPAYAANPGFFQVNANETFVSSSGTTNLATRPSCESLTSTSTSGAAVTLSLKGTVITDYVSNVDLVPFSGTASYKVSSTATGGYFNILSIANLAASTTYTMSFHASCTSIADTAVYATAYADMTNVKVYENGGGSRTLNGSGGVTGSVIYGLHTLSGWRYGARTGVQEMGYIGWQVRHWVTFTTPSDLLAGGSVNVRLPAPVTSGGAVESTYAVVYDGIQIEQSSYMTRYCDGDQPGASWSGTRNASTSTRYGMKTLQLAYDLDPNITGSLNLSNVSMSRQKLGSGPLHGTNYALVSNSATTTHATSWTPIAYNTQDITRQSSDDGDIFTGTTNFILYLAGVYSFSNTATITVLPTLSSNGRLLTRWVTSGSSELVRGTMDTISQTGTLTSSGICAFPGTSSGTYYIQSQFYHNGTGTATLAAHAPGTPMTATVCFVA